MNIEAKIMLNSPVNRDKDGWWSHPGIPDLEEDDDAWKKWRMQQGIELKFSRLEDEQDDHPSYVAYYENADPQVRDWNPEPPVNDPALGDWHTFSIHDTEDGPIWMWARRVA